MSEYREFAEEYLSESVHKEFLQNVDAFAAALAKTTFDAKRKAEYTAQIEEYYWHYGRARELEKEYGQLSREMDKYKKLYEEEPDDRKAEKYKKKYYEAVERRNKVESHHEQAVQDMNMCAPKAQIAKKAVESNLVRNQSKSNPFSNASKKTKK